MGIALRLEVGLGALWLRGVRRWLLKLGGVEGVEKVVVAIHGRHGVGSVPRRIGVGDFGGRVWAHARACRGFEIDVAVEEGGCTHGG